MNNYWVKWPLLEGLSKAIFNLTAKQLGIVGRTLAGAISSTLIIGLVQMSGGYMSGRMKGKIFKATAGQIAAALLFGIIAASCAIIGIFVFTYKNADVALFTFFTCLSLVPSVILGRIFFAEKIVPRQYFGILFFLAAAYFFTGRPSWELILNLPTWIWLSLIVAVLLSINEIISKTVRQMPAAAYNFWIGVAEITFCSIYLTLFGKWRLVMELPGQYLLISIMLGLIVLLVIWLKLKSYKAGGDVGVKTLATVFALLVGATILGNFIFDERLNQGKIIGIICFTIAFCLTSNEVYNFTKKSIKGDSYDSTK